MSHTAWSLIARGTCNPSMLTCQKKSLIRTCPPKSPSSPSSRSGSDSHRRGSDPFAPSSILTLEAPRLTLSMNGRSRSIRQDFRTCADIVCTLQDDDVDLWIQDEERRHLGLRDLPPQGKRLARSTGKGTKNRAIFNLRRNLPTKKLDVETIEAIWKWADDPACFLAETNHNANAHGVDAPTKPLDSICILLSYLETQVQIDRVRRRLLLCFLAWIVDGKIHAVGTQDDVAMLLVQAQLISEVSQECVVKYLEEWLSRGRQYLRLAEKLDGAGALIFLPLWGGIHMVPPLPCRRQRWT
ncbi:hypothetical protein N7494_013179 [Penicillium frequentans]|uniref:Uncharacterized protein n=1 Tax=Penicillium frequentans TaxID=3151616 RepID=A0AAD6CHD5_9EURO|nr:hypothetical protein N7494_013179 [Penicillium glabrum]